MKTCGRCHFQVGKKREFIRFLGDNLCVPCLPVVLDILAKRILDTSTEKPIRELEAQIYKLAYGHLPTESQYDKVNKK